MHIKYKETWSIKPEPGVTTTRPKKQKEDKKESGVTTTRGEPAAGTDGSAYLRTCTTCVLKVAVREYLLWLWRLALLLN
jgi:hypothetical protein